MHWLPTTLTLVFLLFPNFSGGANYQVRVIDGDTIVIGHTHYRLWGIDAPETHQHCAGWEAGIVAKHYMESLVINHEVICTTRTIDRYGRSVALCKADGVDIEREMVRHGMAWAFIKYSRDYEQAEAKAIEENLGIHKHHCQPAWVWRAHQRRHEP